METTELNEMEQKVYELLLKDLDSSFPDGAGHMPVWMMMARDSASKLGLSHYQFAGYLSSLKNKGYIHIDQDELDDDNRPLVRIVKLLENKYYVLNNNWTDQGPFNTFEEADVAKKETDSKIIKA